MDTLCVPSCCDAHAMDGHLARMKLNDNFIYFVCQALHHLKFNLGSELVPVCGFAIAS